ncbi:NRDE protein-domain-containing protein [Lactarius hengduanensis]|nr:NRDE protein-domain-containing protein [Lactarius hengduanensis]
MCVAFWSLTHPEYALILCANRDEFLGRPTLPAHFHSFEALSQPTPVSNPDAPAVRRDKGTGSVLSGRDMLAGGTWLGINRTTGRIALITNITEPPATYTSSRGTLVSSFLGDPSGDLAHDAAALTRQTTRYAGFNLLLLEPLASSSASASTLAYDVRLVSNDGGGGPIHARAPTDAERACGGMSNGVDGHGGDLWPKVVQGKEELGNVLDELSRASGMDEPDEDERLAGRLIELLTCVSASGPVPRTVLAYCLFARFAECNASHFWLYLVACHNGAELELTRSFRPFPPPSPHFSFSAHLPIPPPRERAELKNTIIVPVFDAGATELDAPHAYYGTRLAQVVLVRRNGHVTYIERDIWLPDTTGAPVRAGATDMRAFSFCLGSGS